jgi:hypothetical protein
VPDASACPTSTLKEAWARQGVDSEMPCRGTDPRYDA